MINPKKLVKIAMKGQMVAAIGRRRRYSSRNTTFLADKGHFVVYTADKIRFVVPLSCLSSPVFKELLKMSEDEFGLPRNGPITLPCAADFMDYILSLVRRSVYKDVENALLASISSSRCLTSSTTHEGLSCQHVLEGF